MPRRVAPTHLTRDIRGQLEHLPVQEEEAGETDLVDERELLVEAGASLPLVAVGVAVASLEGAVADPGQLGDRGLVAFGEVRVAVAELLREVELEPLGELCGPRNGFEIVRETFGDRSGRKQDTLVVPAPLALGAFE
jgi:hypothetical protein